MKNKHSVPSRHNFSRPNPMGYPTLRGWLLYATKRIKAAHVNLENGLQEPYLEAEYLARHALMRCSPKGVGKAILFEEPRQWQTRLRHRPPAQFSVIFADFLAQRLKKRMPAAYIVGEAPFAGHLFVVTPQVLIPRSRLENLLDDPPALLSWLGGQGMTRMLDLGTGSGCLAIAFALAFPQVRVDAVDISATALQVARRNCRRFKVQKRVTLLRSDLFSNLAGRRYPLIVANPPYVSDASMEALPIEYRHEPALALSGGWDGLALVEPILRQAANHLTPDGVLVCEVGDETEEIMMKRWPDLPVTWLAFHFGGSGVFAVYGEDLRQWAESLPLFSKND